MFGYIRPYPAEMKVAEYERYKAVYCGICRDIGKTSGQLSRLGLSYDTVLLCSVRMVLSEIKPEYSHLWCAAHPTTKKSVMNSNEASRFTAAAFALLAAAKNADDLADEKGIDRIKPLLLLPISNHLEKCGKKKLEEKAWDNILSMLSELSALEKIKSNSLDETADAFGKVLAYIFSMGYEGEKKEIAMSVGKSAGRYVYMCDAADDLSDDMKKNRYNPIYYGWGDYSLENGKISPMVKESLKTATPIALESIGEAVEKLDPEHELTPIIKNIVYLGLPHSLSTVLDGERKKNRKKFDTEGKI